MMMDKTKTKLKKAIDSLNDVVKESREDIVEQAKKFKGDIKTIDDVFKHIKRLQQCTDCKQDFYDKWCPDCLNKHVEREIKERRKDILNKLEIDNTRDEFPHEKDELDDQITQTIEDDLKYHAEFLPWDSGYSFIAEYWSAYKKTVAWVSYCDRVNIEINNRKEVFTRLQKLWKKVKQSDLYEPKGNG